MSIVRAFTVPHPPLIVPEVGHGRENSIIETIKAYENIAREIEEINPETIIISSPHAEAFSDCFSLSSGDVLRGDFGSFLAEEVSFVKDNDILLIEEIERIAKEKNFPAGRVLENKKLDHGVMVPLYFLRNLKSKIIVVSLSLLSLPKHYEMGKIIQEAVNNLDRKTVFIASGDLSHKLKEYGPYGFIEEGPIYDKKIMNILATGDFLELLNFDINLINKASECGHRSFTIMAGVLDGIMVDAKKLSYQDVTGVGYGICSFIPKEMDSNRCFLDIYLNNLTDKIIDKKNNADDYIKLAYEAVNRYILTGERIDLADDILDDIKNRSAGVFVTIHEFGLLRGCIGTILPTTSCIGEEIITNAISAAVNDHRFSKILSSELDYLEISVDVLGEIEDINSKDELDVLKYGVIVTSGFKRGLLLPNLDGVDSVDKQVSIAKKKAGITNGEEVKLQRFSVERHEMK